MSKPQDINQAAQQHLAVRERRHSSPSTANLRMEINGLTGQIQNISDSGVSFWSEHDITSDGTTEFRLQIYDNSVLNLKGSIIWKRAHEAGFLYGFHFNHQYLPEGFLEANDNIDLIIENLEKERQTFQVVDSEFKALTFDIKNFMESNKMALDKLEEEIQIYSEGTRNSYREVIKAKFEQRFVAELKRFSKKLDVLFSQVNEKNLRKQYIAFFRNEVGVYYTKNPFIGRALRKPRGYAGDYEMMNQIYRDAFEGNSFFEMLMHRYGIQESSSLSVIFRRKYLADKLLEVSQKMRTFTVASIASGPAQEIIQVLERLDPEASGKYTFVLVDQDLEALLNSKRNIFDKIISRNLKCQVHFLPINIGSIIEKSAEAQVLSNFKFDLIYTAGLYDYLTQPVAEMLTFQLSSLIVEGGMMIIGNFHPNNPTKTISELVADWRLVHRSEEEMLQLTRMLNVADKRLLKDDQEIDLFLEVTLK